MRATTYIRVGASMQTEKVFSLETQEDILIWPLKHKHLELYHT